MSVLCERKKCLFTSFQRCKPNLMTMIGLCDGSQFLARCRLEVWKQTLRQSWQYTFIGTNECFALIELTIRFRHRYIQIMTGVKLKVLQEQFKETAIIQLFTSTLTIILFGPVISFFVCSMACKRLWKAFVLLSLVLVSGKLTGRYGIFVLFILFCKEWKIDTEWVRL